MKPFERWKYEEIELIFGTERVKNLAVLDKWLEADDKDILGNSFNYLDFI